MPTCSAVARRHPRPGCDLQARRARAATWCRICWRCSARRIWSAPISRKAALALARSARRVGRGERAMLAAAPAAPLTLIDESYNANPASMAAAMALLGATPGSGARAPHRRARRHARTRRAFGEAASRRLPTRSSANAIDLVFLLRSANARLWRRASRRHAGAAMRTTAARSNCRCCCGARGRRRRHGQRFDRLENEADRHGAGEAISGRARDARRSRSVRRTKFAMFYWLSDISGHDLGLQCLPLHHLPHRRRAGHLRADRLPLRADDHRLSAAAAGQGPADPRRRAADASQEAARRPWAG